MKRFLIRLAGLLQWPWLVIEHRILRARYERQVSRLPKEEQERERAEVEAEMAEVRRGCGKNPT